MKGQHEEKITPERLIEASDAVLMALQEHAREIGGGPISPLALHGSSVQPACLADFTRYEVEEATAFLMRMGMLELPRTV